VPPQWSWLSHSYENSHYRLKYYESVAMGSYIDCQSRPPSALRRKHDFPYESSPTPYAAMARWAHQRAKRDSRGQQCLASPRVG